MAIPTNISFDAAQSSRRILGIESENVERSQLLRRLTEWEYVVPAEHADAMQLLVNLEGVPGQQKILAQADLAGYEMRMEVAVSSFAKNYFNLPIDQRLRSWKVLFDASSDLPRLRQWLRDLESGLDVDEIPFMGDEQLDEFVEKCCSVYVARNSERARLRQELVARCSHDPQLSNKVNWNLKLTQANFVAKVASWTKDSSQHDLGHFDSQTVNYPVVADTKTKPKDSPTSSLWMFIAVIAILKIITAGIRPTHGPEVDRPHRISLDQKWIRADSQSWRTKPFQSDRKQEESLDKSKMDHELIFRHLNNKFDQDEKHAPSVPAAAQSEQ